MGNYDKTARQLLIDALRLINEPGKGMMPSDGDLDDAFTAFQDIITSEGVGKCFRPGIRTHFFNLNSSQYLYTYGPGGDFDTDNFFDEMPVRVESAYIRTGDTITDNELITNSKFNNGSNSWTLGAGWSVLNGEALFDQSVGDGTLTQAYTWVASTVYIIKFDITIDTGEGQFTADGGAFNTTFSSSGSYEFEYTATTASSSVQFESLNGSGDAFRVDNVSIIEKNKYPVELTLNRGSDYPVKCMDQTTYNQLHSKGDGARPDKLLYSRSYPLGEVKFNNQPGTGEIIIMDVTTLPVVTSIDQSLPFHPNSYRYLRYAVADEISPEYGKSLSQRQVRKMSLAKNDMLKGNKRINMLRSDSAILNRSSRFNINSGDY